MRAQPSIMATNAAFLPAATTAAATTPPPPATATTTATTTDTVAAAAASTVPLNSAAKHHEQRHHPQQHVELPHHLLCRICECVLKADVGAEGAALVQLCAIWGVCRAWRCAAEDPCVLKRLNFPLVKVPDLPGGSIECSFAQYLPRLAQQQQQRQPQQMHLTSLANFAAVDGNSHCFAPLAKHFSPSAAPRLGYFAGGVASNWVRTLLPVTRRHARDGRADTGKLCVNTEKERKEEIRASKRASKQASKGERKRARECVSSVATLASRSILRRRPAGVRRHAGRV